MVLFASTIETAAVSWKDSGEIPETTKICHTIIVLHFAVRYIFSFQKFNTINEDFNLMSFFKGKITHDKNRGFLFYAYVL